MSTDGHEQPATSDDGARQRIRKSLDESLIVEAAAGTGKTSELIQRIVAILRSGRTRVHRIVAVTFTRKAAGELKLRLRVELDTARGSAKDTNEVRNLEDALARLEEARIGTIHSFCAEILRQRPVEAQLAPGFEEIDEAQAARVYSRAFDTWIQRRLQEMPAGLRRALSRFSVERFAQDNQPLDRLRDAGWALVQWRDFRRQWRRDAFNREQEIEQLIGDLSTLAKIASECNLSKHPLRERLQCVVDFMSRLKRADEIGRRDLDELEALLIRLPGQLSKWHRKGPRAFSAEFSRDEVSERKKRMIEALNVFIERSNADLAALLQSEMEDLIELYEDLKVRSGKVDFEDLLIRTRNLIRDDRDVRRLLQDRFSHIFVDEFQDTDPVQAEILVLLSADDSDQTEWRKVRPKPGKLFLVGDPKQSIYRFRRADIILYQELCANLATKGVATVRLSHSFRALKPIQEAVNAAFAPEIQRDEATGQPAYVALEGGRPSIEQPSVIALPVPRPYGKREIAKWAIEDSLPEALAAFVDWLIRESGWKVRDAAWRERPAVKGPPQAMHRSDLDSGPDAKVNAPESLVPIRSEHIAILFRRFMTWGVDVTRDYVHALEARNIPHQLWQARSFHQREEVETVRAALNAIEWPDDELSVFATLKGSLFAIRDNLLLRFRHEVGPFHPFRPIAEDLSPDFQPIREVLAALADLHRRRNRRPIVETLNSVLEMARAHAAFALRPSGSQILANVYHICNLARAYELAGAYSFRGFVEQLNEQSESEASGEAPIAEEGAEGVRIMTVHSAKGLEFPIVILADITANRAGEPDKHIDAGQNLCALRLLGCAPWELIDFRQEERKRDLAEGIRVAYVAATRARDLLVVPVVGDKPHDDGWVASLNKALYPARGQYRQSRAAPGCPAFGAMSVLSRPMEYDGSQECSVKPGLHVPENSTHPVVWWDPALLNLDVKGSFGLRMEEILGDGPAALSGRTAYEHWKSNRQQSLERGRVPGLNVFLATDGLEPPAGYADRVQVERVQRHESHPQGARFGSLVHLILRDVELDSQPNSILRLAESHARLLGAPAEEVHEAAHRVATALQHPLLTRARHASRCYRELPLLIKDHTGALLEAVIDLAFLEDSNWVVVDFKTDAEDSQRLRRYRRQVGWYLHAIEKTTGTYSAAGWLLHV
jgi:ATP-dependent helicase/nuclease subunit A